MIASAVFRPAGLAQKLRGEVIANRSSGYFFGPFPDRATTKCELGAMLALVAFQAADALPALRPRHRASAKGGFGRRLIRHTQVTLHASAN